MLMKSKKGMSTSMINKTIEGFIAVIVLFLLYANLIPEAQTSGQSLNDTGVPLGPLFLPTGVVFVLMMVALLLTVIRIFISNGK